MRVRTDLDAGHHLPLEFLDEVGVGQLELLDSHLLASPASLEHFGRGAGTDTPLKLELVEVDQKLGGTS